MEFLILENCLSSNKQVDVAYQTEYFREEKDISLKEESKMKHLETEIENNMKYLTIQRLDEKVCSKNLYQYIQPRPNLGVDITLAWQQEHMRVGLS